MASRSFARRWTYEEFARLPDDGNRYEVIAGELYVTPAPRTAHQEVLTRLIETMGPFVRGNRLGRLLPGADVLFAEGDYLEPDLVFVRQQRREIVRPRGIEAAPDLVIEILSDSTAGRDRGIKRERYAMFGVSEYWIVDADAKYFEIYRLNDDPLSPQIERGVLLWQPILDGPVLELHVHEILSDLE
jgi:Uma2 family endonuclease